MLPRNRLPNNEDYSSKYVSNVEDETQYPQNGAGSAEEVSSD